MSDFSVMPFIDPDSIEKIELFPGTFSGLVAGENLMLSFLKMEQGSVVPPHSHPHEQAGLILEGSLRFKMGVEEKVLEAGQAFLIPPHVVHETVVEKGPAKVLDVFSPIREDYVDRENKYTSVSDQTVTE